MNISLLSLAFQTYISRVAGFIFSHFYIHSHIPKLILKKVNFRYLKIVIVGL